MGYRERNNINMIVDIEKQVGWKDKIIDLEIGQYFYAPLSKRLKTIAPAISRLKNDIRYYYRVFETNKVILDGIEVLKVTRLEDEK